MGTGGSNYFLEPQRYDNNTHCDKTTYNQVLGVIIHPWSNINGGVA